jgi:hypothetical protein
MRSIYTYLFLFAILAISSCQQDLAEQQMPYQGKWESANYTLFIFSNGKGTCVQKKLGLRCNGAVSITDEKIVFTSNSLDAHIFRMRFRIYQKPEVDNNGTSFMILNGERFEQ